MDDPQPPPLAQLCSAEMRDEIRRLTVEGEQLVGRCLTWAEAVGAALTGYEQQLSPHSLSDEMHQALATHSGARGLLELTEELTAIADIAASPTDPPG